MKRQLAQGDREAEAMEAYMVSPACTARGVVPLSCIVQSLGRVDCHGAACTFPNQGADLLPGSQLLESFQRGLPWRWWWDRAVPAPRMPWL